MLADSLNGLVLTFGLAFVALFVVAFVVVVPYAAARSALAGAVERPIGAAASDRPAVQRRLRRAVLVCAACSLLFSALTWVSNGGPHRAPAESPAMLQSTFELDDATAQSPRPRPRRDPLTALVGLASLGAGLMGVRDERKALARRETDVTQPPEIRSMAA
jgi:hypothetical protein